VTAEQVAFTWCRECGRLLTDSESVRQGRGKRCAEKHIMAVIDEYVERDAME
jgi:hypothetical protein